MGGRGAGSGLGRRGAATGGASAQIRISDSRTESVRSFSGNDGLVRDFAIGSTAAESGSRLQGDYDLFVNVSQGAARDFEFAAERKYGVRSGVAIGINLNKPSGASEKQINYATDVMKSRLERVIKGSVEGVALGKNTMQGMADQIAKIPAMSAREILDRFRR